MFDEAGGWLLVDHSGPTQSTKFSQVGHKHIKSIDVFIVMKNKYIVCENMLIDIYFEL